MKSTKRDILIEGVIRVINSCSPEFIEQCEEASKSIYYLIDSIEKFEDECEEQVKVEKEKQDGIKN